MTYTIVFSYPAKYNTTNMGFAIHHQSFSFLLKMSFLTSTEDIGTMDIIIYGKCQVINKIILPCSAVQ